MIVKICVGSSCHLKGSYETIEKMQKLIKENGLEDKVELRASFCIGQCKNGVAVSRDTPEEKILHHVSGNNVEEVFRTEILPFVQ